MRKYSELTSSKEIILNESLTAFAQIDTRLHKSCQGNNASLYCHGYEARELFPIHEI